MVSRFPFEKARVPSSAEGQRRYMALACQIEAEEIVKKEIRKNPCLTCRVTSSACCNTCMHDPKGAA